MICLIAWIVFGILGIFSARYRSLAKESFLCVFRRMTLRKCESTLDHKIKMKLVSKTMKLPKLSRFIYRYFEALSWLFIIVLIVSTFFSVQAAYNLIIHGTCDPNGGVCVITNVKTGCDVNGNCSANCTAENNYSSCSGNCSCTAGTCDV
ncbi:MAG: hypothetical protein J4473_04725 [Candidatus Aenigmarchaeota archaeon]|nr:hypothetical protein [Candidatus Aenigmarchaeota archaeon]